MTLVGPLLFAVIMIIPIWMSKTVKDKTLVLVNDESKSFSKYFESDSDIEYVFSEGPENLMAMAFVKSDFKFLLQIPEINVKKPDGIKLISKSASGFKLRNEIETELNKALFEIRLERSGLDSGIVDSLRVPVKLNMENISSVQSGEDELDSYAGISMFLAVLIYFFIFLYGVQVMRGVIEEKSNRIVEVIISSVKPFQLMLGKIFGIAFVSICQFAIWLFLTISIATFFTSKYQSNLQLFNDEHIQETVLNTQDVQQALEMNQIMHTFNNIDFTFILAVFIFYFFAGYLLYSALFAAVGSLSDNETDTQQFMLPITLPLIFAFTLVTSVLENPDGNIAFWLSMIPLTSPVIMMVRLPYGVPTGELITSMALLVSSFLIITWLAGRIYRVGILLYGKKITYGEVVKWLFYKD